MNPSAKPITGRPRSVEVDRAILQAALDLLAEVGYQGISIEAIAARAGVGRTTIYRRYDSKEELLVDALECSKQELTLPDTGSFWADMEQMIAQIDEFTKSDLMRQTMALTISTASSSPKFAEIHWKKYMEPRRKEMSKIFERAKQRGELAENLDIELAIDMIMGLIVFSVLVKPGKVPVKERLNLALKTFLPT